MSKKEIIVLFAGTSWSLLGCKRGLQSYDYNFRKSVHKEPYLYISKGQQGFLGIFLYINPLLVPFHLYKEMYRLEVNLRGLEEEKKTDYYNQLF
jgi:hypothetical protein